METRRKEPRRLAWCPHGAPCCVPKEAPTRGIRREVGNRSGKAVRHGGGTNQSDEYCNRVGRGPIHHREIRQQRIAVGADRTVFLRPYLDTDISGIIIAPGPSGPGGSEPPGRCAKVRKSLSTTARAPGQVGHRDTAAPATPFKLGRLRSWLCCQPGRNPVVPSYVPEAWSPPSVSPPTYQPQCLCVAQLAGTYRNHTTE